MSRRSFLERIAALVGTSIAAPVVQASTIRTIELQRSPVAGFQYHNGEAVWPLLTLGAALDLVREPDNAYDSRAIRVDWQGNKLGYLPRIENTAVSHLLDGGQNVTARIVALQDGDNPWQRIELAVFMVL
jgi:hypothetical protein